MPKGKTEPTTPLMVLALLDRAGRPMSTYEMSLHVCDQRENPRPLSIIVRSLSRDGYLEAHSKRGRRTSLWRLTDQGRQSVAKRDREAKAALRIIDRKPCMTDHEKTVLRVIKRKPAILCEISIKTGLPTGKVRTALKRLILRKNIAMNNDGAYAPIT